MTHAVGNSTRLGRTPKIDSPIKGLATTTDASTITLSGLFVDLHQPEFAKTLREILPVVKIGTAPQINPKTKAQLDPPLPAAFTPSRSEASMQGIVPGRILRDKPHCFGAPRATIKVFSHTERDLCRSASSLLRTERRFDGTNAPQEDHSCCR